MKKYFLLFIIFSSFSSCIKWNLDRLEIISFDRTFPSSNNDIGTLFKKEVIETDNSYVVAGNTNDGSLMLSFINKNGSLLNDVILDLGSANSIIQNENNLVVTSNIDSTFFLNVFSSVGSIIESFNYFDELNTAIGILKNVQAQDIIQLQNKDFIISALIQQEIGPKRLALIKINSFYQLEWIRSYQNNTFMTSLVEDNEGNIVGSGYEDGKAFVAKFSANGNQLDIKTYNQSLNDSLNNLLFFDNRIYVTYTSTKEEDKKIAVVCIDNNFSTLWNNSLSESNFKGFIIAPQADSTLMLLGSNYADSEDLHLINLNRDGSFNWSEIYPSQTFQQPYGLFQTEEKGLVLFSQANSEDENMFHFIRTDSRGKLE